MSQHQQDISYLQTLQSIRERTHQIWTLALADQLAHFHVRPEKLSEAVDLVMALIRRDYASPADVPMHSRWRHFDVGGRQRVTDQLLGPWKQASVDSIEQCRRLLDLFVVSVLLDAGAGDIWKYKELGTGEVYGRSEGLAVASLDMFMQGLFSSDADNKWQCDGDALESLKVEQLAKGLQADVHKNPLVGLEGRCALLNRLGTAVKKHSDLFGGSSSCARPGNLIDYLIKNSEAGKSGYSVDMGLLWRAVIVGFGDVWPATRTKIDGKPIGDVWPCESLKNSISSKGFDADVSKTTLENAHLVPFHKLSQWLTYSLMEPMTKLASVEFKGSEFMTGLAEYRNGGLFVDLGILELKKESHARGISRAKEAQPSIPESDLVPLFDSYDQVIVEWRALTVALLDQVGELVRKGFGRTKEQMPLVNVLEGGTWKAGREIAAKKRPKTKGPPFQIVSDGTVF